jgi:hypothetical protein
MLQVVLNFSFNGSGQTKVSYLHSAILVDEAIRWLEVSVIYSGGVDVVQASQKIVQQHVDMERGEGHIRLAKLLEICVDQFHYHVNVCEHIFCCRDMEGKHFYHIRMIEL